MITGLARVLLLNGVVGASTVLFGPDRPFESAGYPCWRESWQSQQMSIESSGIVRAAHRGPGQRPAAER